MKEDNKDIDLVVESNLSTVIAEYIPTKSKEDKYQSEADLEKELISILQNNGYEYVNIKNNDDLLANAREQLSILNNYNFSDNEWNLFIKDYLCNKGDSKEEKTYKIQENDTYDLSRDNGSTKNISIIDKTNIHNNIVQVINQYEVEGNYKNRYDVSILVNGLPLCHIELKRRGVALKEAFNQINRYKRDSFWADSALFDYVQLFVISNGTHSKYYSNTTRSKKSKNSSFEFTSWWTDSKNNRIADLVDFAKTFLSKHTLLSIITKYCVFTVDKDLLVMRPYQIVASEFIINKIEQSTNYNKLGTIEAGGYIWHTTGSGKTLTSFKTSQLATKLNFVDKVLFVVDRKDLDSQTVKEYNKFKKDSVQSNASTKVLSEQLSSNDTKIVVTTIQKLDRFISSVKNNDIFNKHVVIIFDECHRSQFGTMHTKITKTFKKYNIFGFTGTPIFAENSKGNKNPLLKTTEQAFGNKLHSYTIVDAIKDENVLSFKVDYHNTFKIKEDIEDKQVKSIDIEKALQDPERITLITKYILEHFNQKTKRDNGGKFNSIFATSSISSAKLYYDEFKKQQENLTDSKKLKIGLIYSFGANDEVEENGLLADEELDTSNIDKNMNKSDRDFLEQSIKDYNDNFSTNYDTSSDKFQLYYVDLSTRVKKSEIDILIVVNMFLTGFDAKTLNTLWVDKNLQYHGLLQAFSRTNRIYNNIKDSGNIVCFRNLEKNTNDAISIFGDKDVLSFVIAPSYEEYYNGYTKGDESKKGYFDLISELQNKFSLPVETIGEQEEKDFINLFGEILKLNNILTFFDQFEDNKILSEREFQDYKSIYLDLYDKLRKNKADIEGKEFINDDITFEMELVKQVNINIDYILILIDEYKKSKMLDTDKLTSIQKAVNSSIDLRSKKELIERFIDTINIDSNVVKDWGNFISENYQKDLNEIIESEKLDSDLTLKFMKGAFENREIKEIGTDFASILPPISRFNKDKSREKKKNDVMTKLLLFFEKYLGLPI